MGQISLPHLSVLDLSSLMIHMVITLINQLRHRHKGIPLILQGCDQHIQRLGSIFCPVVTEDDAAVPQVLVLGYRLNDGIHAIVLPVERITPIYKSKYF